MPTIDRLIAITQGDLHSRPQAAELCRHGLLAIAEGLRHLAQHGYVFHLEPGPVPDGDFPHVMYHISMPPRQVNCQADIDDLGAGWYMTPQEAARAAGVAAQFLGRAGVGLKGTLSVVLPHMSRNGLGGISELKPRADVEELREANRANWSENPPMETK